MDKRQVFLPINNALSDVGHVHGFLQELGQGVQHIASHVEDLMSFCSIVVVVLWTILEFIQRVRSSNKIKPGCGGFGIHNFLTLFLSIEVSKAMKDLLEARWKGHAEDIFYYNGHGNEMTTT